MPVLPSTVRLICTVDGVTEFVQVLISPATGDLATEFATAADGGYLVTIPGVVSPELLAAFGPTGDPVPLSIVATSPEVTVRLEPAAGVTDVVIVGLQDLGENADAATGRARAGLGGQPSRRSRNDDDVVDHDDGDRGG